MGDVGQISKVRKKLQWVQKRRITIFRSMVDSTRVYLKLMESILSLGEKIAVNQRTQ